MTTANKLGGHPKFYEVRRANEKLYSQKHYQYATDEDPMSNFRLCGQLMQKLFKPGVNPTIAAALTLMSKQIVGVYEIVGEGKENTVESLEDKLKDIEIYASILQVLVDETKWKPAPKPPLGAIRLVPNGPFCDECSARLADFRQDNGKHLAPRYWCSDCACEKDVDTSDMTLLEQVA